MKKNLLLIALLFVLSLCLFSCGKGEEDPVENPTVDTPTPTYPTKTDDINVIKTDEAVVLDVDDIKEYDLNNYITYTGTEYTFNLSTENKGVVNAQLVNGKLIINAVKGGNENVVVSLNNKKITFRVTVNETTVTPVVELPVFEDLEISYSIDKNNSYEVTMAPKDANGYEDFTYSLKTEIQNVEIVEDKLVLTLSSVGTKTFVVVVSFGDELTLEFNVIVTTTMEKNVNVLNGSFDNGLEGWTLKGEFGVITDKSSWWTEEMPMFNEGNYFSGYDVDGTSYESLTGTLTSSIFTLAGNGYISFMLGGAANENCYITVETTQGEVIALYRNTMFTDFPEGFILGENIEEGKAMVGNTVFMANFVKYKADLSKYIGQELKVVVHDNATSGWGLLFFDELNTYNAGELEDYVLAINELADFTELNSLFDLEIKSQFDFTLESYANYQNTINNAKEMIKNIGIKQETVDSLCADILTAVNNLVVRDILVKDVELNKVVIVNNTVELLFADYFDTNDLSSVTFTATSDYQIVVTDKGVVLPTEGLESLVIEVTLNALYKDEVKQTVTINIEVTGDPTPVVKDEVINIEVDFYQTKTNKFEYDLTSNIENVAGLESTYSLLVNENWEELEETTILVDELGLYEYEVKVSAKFNEEEFTVTYLLVIEVIDTTEYQLINGDFETGNLEGWTLYGPMGAVSSNTNYWLNDSENVLGYEFGLEGSYMFSAYATDVESAYGALSSSKFIVGGSGWMTFKIGAAKNTDWVNIQVVDAANGDILMTFGNTNWQDRTNGAKSGCTLIPYKADLSSLLGKEVYIRVVDNAKNDYGLFFLDSFFTYHKAEPSDEYSLAVDLGIRGNIYEMVNGGFEEGLKGWSVYDGEEPGKVSDLNGYWNSNISFEKDGNFLFHGLEGQSFETDPSLEYRMGVLRSNIVMLKANSIIAFKLGGAKNNTTGIRIVNAATNEVMASFYNTEFNKHEGNEGRLMQYVYEFSNESEVLCYIEIYDASTSDWGLICVDSIVCNLASKDLVDGFEAINQIN